MSSPPGARAASHLGASRSATLCGGSTSLRKVLLSQGAKGAKGLFFGAGGRRRTGGRGRRGVMLVEAKIWTNDGRRKAAEMMGLSVEVRAPRSGLPPRHLRPSLSVVLQVVFPFSRRFARVLENIFLVFPTLPPPPLRWCGLAHRRALARSLSGHPRLHTASLFFLHPSLSLSMSFQLRAS
jgi:hypothetical protein